MMKPYKPSDAMLTFGGVAEQVERSRRQRAERSQFYEEVKSTITRAVDPTAGLKDINGEAISATARAILVAGMKRRNELVEEPQFPDNESGRKAKAIVNSARKARNEPPL